MKINKNLDYIQNSNTSLYQSDEMFKVNTDTSLLAHFMKLKDGESLLDIGTNNGALLMYAYDNFKPSYMYGIDIQCDAIEVAKYNMLKANISNVDLIVGDASKVKLAKVNVVICNPPYFKTNASAKLKVNESLNIARHEIFLTLEMMCQIGEQVLDTKGRFYFVHRADRIADIFTCCHQHRLQIKTLQFVYDQNKKEAISVLVEAYKDGAVHTKIMKPITITRNG